jgi:hypothetical protein
MQADTRSRSGPNSARRITGRGRSFEVSMQDLAALPSETLRPKKAPNLQICKRPEIERDRKMNEGS